MKLVIREIAMVVICGAMAIAALFELCLSIMQVKNFIDPESYDIPEWLGTTALVILVEAILAIVWWAFH